MSNSNKLKDAALVAAFRLVTSTWAESKYPLFHSAPVFGGSWVILLGYLQSWRIPLHLCGKPSALSRHQDYKIRCRSR